MDDKTREVLSSAALAAGALGSIVLSPDTDEDAERRITARTIAVIGVGILGLAGLMYVLERRRSGKGETPEAGQDETP